ncbi:hypothetical protein MN116_000617 [Schistosoma mekongi]|uniref:Junctophilin n=1 Tax=Schistosoma mekongi TaxID=38744 RepID=A0AAE1ZK92_SCHME|nr:hypothetical protein MN116_000617 [Schistosoma mekongi]
MNTDGGRFDFNDGGTYIGNWLQGSAHGLGLATGPNGVGEYSGEWNLGFETCGVYLWPNGNMYAGTWIKGKRHGDGVQVRGKWIYQGEFNAGSFGQYGVKTSINSQAKYEGSWSLNRFEGFGIETCADGSIYAGAWSKGFRHGLGVRKSFISYKTSTSSENSINTSTNTTEIGVTTSTTVTTPTLPTECIHDVEINNNIDPNKKTHHLTSQSPKTSDKRHSSTVNLQSKESISVSRKAVIGRAIMRRLKKQHSAIELGRSINNNQSISFNGTTTPKTTSPIQSKKLPAASNEQPTNSINEEQTKKKLNDTHHEHIDYSINNEQLISVIEIYSGEWFQDQRSGYGIAERSNGFVYIGEWIRNQKHGYGIIINPNGTRDEGQFQANNLINKINRKSKLHLVRQTKLKECVEDALIRAESAAKQAKLIASEEAKERALKARKSADLAITIIQKALHLSNQARELAFQLEPQFHQPGIEWRKKCQFEMNFNDDFNEQTNSSTLYMSNSHVNIFPEHQVTVSITQSTSSSTSSSSSSSAAAAGASSSDTIMTMMTSQLNENDQQIDQQITNNHIQQVHSNQSELDSIIKPSIFSLMNRHDLKLSSQQHQHTNQIKRKFFHKLISHDSSTLNSIDQIDDLLLTDTFERFAHYNNNPKFYRFVKPITQPISSSSSSSSSTTTTTPTTTATTTTPSTVTSIIMNNELIRPLSAPYKTNMNELTMDKVIMKRNYSPNDRTISPLKEVSNEDVEQNQSIESIKRNNVDMLNKQLSSSLSDISSMCKASKNSFMNNLRNLSPYQHQQHSMKSLTTNTKLSNSHRSTSELFKTTLSNNNNVKNYSPSTSSSDIGSLNRIENNNNSKLITSYQSMNKMKSDYSQLIPFTISQSVQSNIKQDLYTIQSSQQKMLPTKVNVTTIVNSQLNQHPPKLGMNSTQDSGYLSMDPNESRSFSIQTFNHSITCHTSDTLLESHMNDNDLAKKHINNTIPVSLTTVYTSLLQPQLITSYGRNSNCLQSEVLPSNSFQYSMSLSPKAKKFKAQIINNEEDGISLKSHLIKRQMISARRKLSTSPRRLYRSDGSYPTLINKTSRSHTTQHYSLKGNTDLQLKQMKVQLKSSSNIPMHQLSSLQQYTNTSMQSNQLRNNVIHDIDNEKSQFNLSTIQSTPYYHTLNTDSMLNEFNSNQIKQFPMNFNWLQSTNELNSQWDHIKSSNVNHYQRIPIVYTSNWNDDVDDDDDKMLNNTSDVLLSPEDNVDDDDDDDDNDIYVDNSTLYKISTIPSDYHSLERYTSSLQSQRLHDDQRVMRDHSTRSNIKPYILHHSNYYQNLHHLPINKLASSMVTDEDTDTINYDRYKSIEYMKQPSSQRIPCELYDPIIIDSRKINIKRSNHQDYNRYKIDKNTLDNINFNFQPSSSPSTLSLISTTSTSSLSSASSASSSSSSTSTLLSTPTLSFVNTNSICPSKYVSTPLTSANVLWSQAMNPFYLRNSMYTGSLKQFPRKILQSTHPNYLSYSLTDKQFHSLYNQRKFHHHHHHHHQQQQQQPQPQQQPPPQQQQEQQFQLLHHQPDYSIFKFNKKQTILNNNERKYSTIPLDRTMLIKQRPITKIDNKKIILTNIDDTLISSFSSSSSSSPAPPPPPPPPPLPHYSITPTSIDMINNENWLQHTMQSNEIHLHTNDLNQGIPLTIKDEALINQYHRRISWPHTLYEFIPETCSDEYSNSTVTVTNIDSKKAKLEVSSVIVDLNRSPVVSMSSPLPPPPPPTTITSSTASMKTNNEDLLPPLDDIEESNNQLINDLFQHSLEVLIALIKYHSEVMTATI